MGDRCGLKPSRVDAAGTTGSLTSPLVKVAPASDGHHRPLSSRSEGDRLTVLAAVTEAVMAAAPDVTI